MLLAPELEGPNYVFRAQADGSWCPTDAAAPQFARDAAGNWVLTDGAVELGRLAPRPDEAVVPQAAAAEGPVPGLGLVDPADPVAVFDLIVSAARERDARAAASAAPRVTDDPQDGERPPRGQWLLGASPYRLSFLDLGLREEALLALECEHQERLRPWREMLTHVEHLCGPPGGLVLDLGCGAGAAAQQFVGRGAEVLGVDSDARMVAAARARCPHGRFRCADAGRLQLCSELVGAASGVWCSFAAAHFPGRQLERALQAWAWLLKPGGWLCVVDVEGLFSVHRPYAETRWARDFRQLDDDLQNVLKYDVFVGQRLAAACRKAKLQVVSEREWPGATEYNFEGSATQEQAAAWAARMERGPINAVFHRYFRDFERDAKEAFLGCLQSKEHTTRCKVKMVVCLKPEF